MKSYAIIAFIVLFFNSASAQTIDSWLNVRTTLIKQITSIQDSISKVEDSIAKYIIVNGCPVKLYSTSIAFPTLDVEAFGLEGDIEHIPFDSTVLLHETTPSLVFLYHNSVYMVSPTIYDVAQAQDGIALLLRTKEFRVKFENIQQHRFIEYIDFPSPPYRFIQIGPDGEQYLMNSNSQKNYKKK